MMKIIAAIILLAVLLVGGAVVFMDLPFAFLLGIPGLILGFIAIMLARSAWRGAGGASSWARTTARIKTISFCYGAIDVTYDYDVEGTVMSGQSIVPGPLRNRSGGMTFPRRTYLNPDGTLRFRPGSDVEAYYDPHEPSDAALVVGISPGTWQAIAFMIALLTILGLFIWAPDWLSRHKVGLCSSLFLAGGLFVMLYGLKNLKRHIASKSFPSTPGRILKAEVAGTDGGYVPSVEFSYAVDGVPYQSGQITAINVRVVKRRPEEVEPFNERLMSQREVTVFYDPLAPWDGFMHHGPLSGVLMTIFMGLFAMGMGIAFSQMTR